MDNMITTQLIIIGAGPGGYETAIAAAEQGLEVVLIESNALGGTCLNEGCIPTKCLCRSAEIMDDIKEAGLFGAECQLSGFNLAQAMQRKNEVVNQLCSGIAGMLKKVTVVNGKAEFDGPTIIKVNGESYTAPNIIIATGSEAK
ncbi:dihydrolipoyl dehydrogenase, partial [gut metagenome]